MKLSAVVDRACGLAAGKLPNDNVDYVTGANIAGFIKVADAMVAYGAV